MMHQYYAEARKLGLKEFRSCQSRGESPYLRVLDEIIPEKLLLRGTNLGIMQIPAEFIVGTKTRIRTEAFAKNFMPLLEENTEFAFKWSNLCASHLEEGIRDPILVYEYCNRFYVEEGNKRVSVLKFFDAVNIPATVIRIMPEQTPENELYYEYLAFNRVSGINYLEFSKSGSYAQFQWLLGKKPDEEWTEEERRRFKSDYFFFRDAYEAKGGSNLNATVGDALIAFIRVYGHPALHSMSSAELKNALSKVWEEMKLQQESHPIAVMTDPSEGYKPGILSQLLPTPVQGILKVAFLHDGNPQVSGWTLGHELGKEHVGKVFKGKIDVVSYMNALHGNPFEALENAISEGAEVIFTTSPRLLPASLRTAVQHPNVKILNCSLNKSHRYIRTYYARMFEAKFIIGAVAGVLTNSDRVGYICDYPIWGQIAGINAFALGVQTVNPRATVFLDWSSVDGRSAAQKRLAEKGMHIISTQDMARLSDSRSSFGLAHISSEGTVQLATPYWNWGVYYEEILRRILNNSFQKEYETSHKAINYYWGMAAGVVGLELSDQVPESVRKLAYNLRDSICAGVIHPFRGPIYKQNGTRVCDESSSLSLEEIIEMDYLVENVQGSIPAYDKLTPIGKSTVDLVGVQSVRKPAKTGGTEASRNADSCSFG